MECGDSVIFLIVGETLSYPHRAIIAYIMNAAQQQCQQRRDVLHQVFCHIFINLSSTHGNKSPESYLLCIQLLFSVIFAQSTSGPDVKPGVSVWWLDWDLRGNVAPSRCGVGHCPSNLCNSVLKFMHFGAFYRLKMVFPVLAV